MSAGVGCADRPWWHAFARLFGAEEPAPIPARRRIESALEALARELPLLEARLADRVRELSSLRRQVDQLAAQAQDAARRADALFGAQDIGLAQRALRRSEELRMALNSAEGRLSRLGARVDEEARAMDRWVAEVTAELRDQRMLLDRAGFAELGPRIQLALEGRGS